MRAELEQSVGRGGVSTILPSFPDGFHPFWFWNDHVTADGIVTQIAEMAAKGIKGFFIHSRQGLQIPYLSAPFLDLVEVAFTEARVHGLSVHLYDEFPYPSGAAGGATVQSDATLVATRLEVTTWRSDGGAIHRRLPAGRLLVCSAFPVHGDVVDWDQPTSLIDHVGMLLTRTSLHESGLGSYNDRRYFADAPMPVVETVIPGGQWEICAVSQVVVADHKYWREFPDMTESRAVERFLELTHERYKERLGVALCGAVSVFVDEVSPEVSASVIREMECRYRGDQGAWLVALTCSAHPAHLAILREVDEVRLAVFEASFESRVSGWCARHGVRYAGEKPSIRLSQLAWMDVPGCEPGHTKAGAPRSDLLRPAIRSNARATASAAYLYAKEGSLCECYHSLGWGATLQDAKLIAESLLALGTRWLVPHAFFYSTRGLRKYDAPPSFFHMPHWVLFGALSARVEAISAALAMSSADVNVALVEPSASMPDTTQLACYEELQHRLVAVGCDFLTADLDVLAEAPMVGGGASVRDVSLRAVILPPGRLPVPDLERWLASYERAGGLVLRVAGRDDIDATVNAVLARCPGVLDLIAEAGRQSSLLTTCRRSPDGRHWLTINTSGQAVNIELSARHPIDLTTVDLAGEPAPELIWDGQHGRLRLDPFESVLLAETCVASGNAEGATRRDAVIPGRVRAVLKLPTDGMWSLHPLGPNIARLGQWRLTLGGREGAAVVEPAPIANQLRRSGLGFVPVVTDPFGLSPGLEFPALRLRYETTIACKAGPAVLSLAMEPGAIEGSWRLFLDGVGPFGAADFSPGQGPVNGCVVLELPACPASHCPGSGPSGYHEVVVEVDTCDSDEGLVDVVYVVGDVAVWSPPPSLGSTVQTMATAAVPTVAMLGPAWRSGRLGEWERSGLGCFAGTLELARRKPLDVPAGSSEVVVELDLPRWFEDALELSFGGGPWHPLPWSPRRAVVPSREIADATGPGGTDVRLRVHTTLARAFEGRWFDPSVHGYRRVELPDMPRSS